MKFANIGLGFLKTSKVWLFGLVFSVLTIQGVLCSIEISNIRHYIEDACDKNAETFESAIKELDIFALRNVLWRIYDGRTNYISFQSEILNKKKFPTVELGPLKSGSYNKIMSYDILYSGLAIGKVTYSVDFFELFVRVIRSNGLLYVVLVGIFFVIFFLSNFAIYLVIHRLEGVINAIADLKEFEEIEKKGRLLFNPYGSWFFSYNSTGTKRIFDKIRTLLRNERTAIQNQTMVEVAKQVSHDIRSPLAALAILMNSKEDMSGEDRVLVRSAVTRISDIANELLRKSNKFKNTNAEVFSHLSLSESCEKQAVYLLAPQVESIITEKRVQFRIKQGIEIETDLEQGYGVFVRFNSIELKRIISNLVNNSVEALSNENGKVTVSLKISGARVKVSVDDNGRGIPKAVLNKLGQMGVTYGKSGTDSGSGLGIYHSIKSVENAGGEFSIESEEGRGTVVTLTFNKEDAPQWFKTGLLLFSEMNIVILDDDISIHHLWRSRLDSPQFRCLNIQFRTFTSSSELRSWHKVFKKEFSNKKLNTLFLIDYELLRQNGSGLDLIEELGISEQSVLVTSHYEEEVVRNRCEELRVKLIPKPMVGFVPITVGEVHACLDLDVLDGDSPFAWSKVTDANLFEGSDARIRCDLCLIDDDAQLINRPIETNSTPMSISNGKVRYDLCLIDDDQELIGVVWATVAAAKGLKIRLFATPQAFVAEADRIERQTPIYVDVSLGNGVSGLDIAHDIHKMGFTEINLATGYDSEFIDVPPFIRRVVGKDFPDLTK